MLKIGNDYELVTEIERLIIEEQMSPYAAAELIKINLNKVDLHNWQDFVIDYLKLNHRQQEV